MTAARTSIAVALDFAQRDRIVSTARAVAEHVDIFKVGLTALYGAGPPIVTELASRGPVFCDAKLHDIPAQVAGATTAISDLGASYVTVHAAGGRDMIAAAVEEAGDDCTVLGVTVLTSIDEGELDHLGLVGPTMETVLKLTERSLAAGAGGVVCSPLEAEGLRTRFGARSEGGPLLAVPGIRGASAPADDQRRTLPAPEAAAKGADILIVGRPITASVDPGAAAQDLMRSLV
jgi:orotidine-5'-phosphate decarboxylase